LESSPEAARPEASNKNAATTAETQEGRPRHDMADLTSNDVVPTL